MTKRIPQPRSELPPSVREHEAKLLAVMLRTSRLTWVFGEPGTDTGALLKAGVMPLLQRRQGDRGAASAKPDRPAVTERREPLHGPNAEVVIHFDNWAQAPLTQLKCRIRDIVPDVSMVDTTGSLGLAETLRRVSQRLGLRFILLLDRFDEYLAMSLGDAEVVEFANELVAAASHHDLAASILVALDEAARPRLERFRTLIPGFDHNVLRLSPVAVVCDQPPRPPARMALASPSQLDGKGSAAQPRRGPPPRVPIKVEDVYELIESTLAKTKQR